MQIEHRKGTAMKLLVAIDFSENTGAVVGHAKTLASALGAEVFLLHVIAPATPVLDTQTGLEQFPFPQDNSGITESSLPASRAHEELEAFVEILRNEGLSVSAHLAHNDEVKAIIDAAERFDADIIVLGSHGHGALYHLLIGSVSEGVVRKSSCPVLIVPAQGK